MSDVMTMFKLTIGDLTPGTEQNEYYQNFIDGAKAHLLSEDIDENVLLSTELGTFALVAHAEALMQKRDIASDPTLLLLRNKLSARTKGNRYDSKS